MLQEDVISSSGMEEGAGVQAGTGTSGLITPEMVAALYTDDSKVRRLQEERPIAILYTSHWLRSEFTMDCPGT